MKKLLFFYFTLIIFFGLVVFFALSVYITHVNNLNIAKNTVMETAQIFATLYDDSIDMSSFVKASNDTRITIISSDGKVLVDSLQLDMAALETHLNRPEIKAALNGSPMAHVRYSESLGVDFIYYALKVEVGGNYVFIRAAVPVAEINTYLFQSLPLLVLLLFIVALFCFVFVRGTINKITKPFESIEKNLRSLSDGEYLPGNIARSYEEIDKIAQNIDEVALVLQNSINDLRNERNKLAYILNNIGDGLFAVDENINVVLINVAALDIFSVNSEISGKNLNYLSSDKILVGAVNDCINQEKDVLFEHTLNGHIFFAAVKRLPDTKLTMVILSDVTESRENSKRREEFFANASHELKTPLTAIKGFNELTTINNKDDNVRKYIDGITRETDRMLTLIADMLKLSELENKHDINPISVTLSKIVDEVREVLSALINEKAIIFESNGDVMITAEQGHIYELVKNLIENAVQYNNQGGRVSVTVESNTKNVRLIVSDNGIGIPLKEQMRIFERFYRVEKSRSQRNGGTGLGLSIVKHICALYGWKLSLKSKPGVGTEIVVVFNK